MKLTGEMRSSYVGRNYPTNWQLFVDTKPTAGELRRLRVTEARADFFRWAAAYRYAKSFLGATFAAAGKIGPDTKALYDCGLRNLLTYSCFEQFCSRVLLVKMDEDKDLKQLQDPYGQAAIIDRIRTLDPGYKFFGFLHDNLDDPKLKARLKHFIAGTQCNVSFIGKVTRHAFAHGRLAASSGVQVLSPGVTEITEKEKILELVHAFLLKRMDDEFQRRVINRLPVRREPVPSPPKSDIPF